MGSGSLRVLRRFCGLCLRVLPGDCPGLHRFASHNFLCGGACQNLCAATDTAHNRADQIIVEHLCTYISPVFPGFFQCMVVVDHLGKGVKQIRKDFFSALTRCIIDRTQCNFTSSAFGKLINKRFNNLVKAGYSCAGNTTGKQFC